jgi:hypothetical protein
MGKAKVANSIKLKSTCIDHDMEVLATLRASGQKLINPAMGRSF